MIQMEIVRYKFLDVEWIARVSLRHRDCLLEFVYNSSFLLNAFPTETTAPLCAYYIEKTEKQSIIG